MSITRLRLCPLESTIVEEGRPAVPCIQTGAGSGLLLHVTSLPSRFGMGDVGPAATGFVTALSEAGQSFWQVLPLHPTLENHQHSPYHATSAFALNPLFISPEVMAEEGIIGKSQLSLLPASQGSGCRFPGISPEKDGVSSARQPGRTSVAGAIRNTSDSVAETQSWLEDAALFLALARQRGADWSAWPPGIRDRDPSVLREQRDILAPVLEEEKYLQYLVFSQWDALLAHARQCGILHHRGPPSLSRHTRALMSGPAGTCSGSTDDGRLLAVAGVPPDYFSRTGQRWGNPVFSWEEMERQEFSWWTDRVSHALFAL